MDCDATYSGSLEREFVRKLARASASVSNPECGTRVYVRSKSWLLPFVSSFLPSVIYWFVRSTSPSLLGRSFVLFRSVNVIATYSLTVEQGSIRGNATRIWNEYLAPGWSTSEVAGAWRISTEGWFLLSRNWVLRKDSGTRLHHAIEKTSIYLAYIRVIVLLCFYNNVRVALLRAKQCRVYEIFQISVHPFYFEKRWC